MKKLLILIIISLSFISQAYADIRGDWKGYWESNNGVNRGSIRASMLQNGSDLGGVLTLYGSPCLQSGSISGIDYGNKNLFMSIRSGLHLISFNGRIISPSLISGTYSSDAGACRGDSGTIRLSLTKPTLPANASANKYSDGWKCNKGYTKSGDSCIKNISIPPNAYAFGSSWKCNDGYYRDYQNCRKLPPNGFARYDGEDFSDGQGLGCESGYEMNKFKRCVESVDDDIVYSASSGSGFAVTDDGYVVTNYHVIDGCTDVKIHDKGKSIPATLVTFDPNNDIALLKGNFKPKSYYPLSRKSPKLLTEVYVAGHPFGQEISTSVKVTKGIISSLTGIANNFSNIQIDAALQPGNSGGPIMNNKGNVIGVAVAKLDLKTIVDEYGVVPENVNFGIKSNIVVNMLESENIDTPEPNSKIISTGELGEMITDGTYYLSCWMTIAQINNLKERKVMFNNF